MWMKSLKPLPSWLGSSCVRWLSLQASSWPLLQRHLWLKSGATAYKSPQRGDASRSFFLPQSWFSRQHIALSEMQRTAQSRPFWSLSSDQLIQVRAPPAGWMINKKPRHCWRCEWEIVPGIEGWFMGTMPYKQLKKSLRLLPRLHPQPHFQDPFLIILQL